jgi:hypothetical protein
VRSSTRCFHKTKTGGSASRGCSRCRPTGKNDLERLQNSEETPKRRISAARGFRNQRIHHLLPILLQEARRPANPVELRVTLLEALGWFQYSHRRDEIFEALEGLLADSELEASVAAEARKTMARLEAGPNEPLTP